jgi:serine/threonine protein kinase
MFEILKKIGEGSCSVVYMGYYLDKFMCMKEGKINDRRIDKELKVRERINHPYIINVIKFELNPNKFVLLMDLCCFGSIHDLINNHKTNKTKIPIEVFFLIIFLFLYIFFFFSLFFFF